MWLLDREDDLDADFRAFYGLSWDRALETVTGPRLAALAWRTAVHGGAVRAWALAETAETGGGQTERIGAAKAAATMPDLFERTEVKT